MISNSHFKIVKQFERIIDVSRYHHNEAGNTRFNSMISFFPCNGLFSRTQIDDCIDDSSRLTFNHRRENVPSFKSLVHC